ncbi:VWA domain-containing protein [Imhoffiella purpurea]|nr:vWA domain-containing protein [Imhoffiella purpurea]
MQLIQILSLRQGAKRLPILLTLLLSSLWLATATAKTPDVRILIDVSGSMRQTDPGNLRVPALQLVNELLPAGARSGVWLFAEKTEELSPPETVDDRWKGKTRSQLKRIHSRGLFTDIEQAIATATVGWDRPDEEYERHLVLLTDGIVDVSKVEGESAASRERIVSTQLERLKEEGVKVHTIALSNAVDTDLLHLLSDETGGWFETAKDADALQRVFLHMLEQSAAPTTVPLKGNAFEIDGQVSEFTLLAFREGDNKTELTTPDGETLSSARPPPGVIWRAELGYDLITISNPKPGEWRLQGVSDPDNRVVVITDLGIEVGELPSRILAGEALRIETWLTDHRQPVTRPDLLKLLSASVVRTSTEVQSPPAQEAPAIAQAPPAEEGMEPGPDTEPAQAQSNAIDMTLDAESSRFQATLNTSSLEPGTYQLQFVIDGGTFERQLVRHFKVSGPPISVKFEQRSPSEQLPTHAIDVIIDAEPELIDPGSLAGYLLLKAPKDKETALELSPPKQLPTGIRFPVLQPGEYELSAKVFAQTLKGNPITFAPDPGHFNFEFEPPQALQDEDESDADADFSWLDLTLVLAGGNIALALLIGPTILYLKGPSKTGKNQAKGAAGKAGKTKKRKAK